MEESNSEELELRMFFLTLYNISGIQKGIQCGHAAVRYIHKYKNELLTTDFVENHETWIIKNGGTTISMQEHLRILQEMDIKLTFFHEPDLNNSLTAIALIADERAFDKKTYPNFETWITLFGFSDYSVRSETEKKEIESKYLNEVFGGDEKMLFLRNYLMPIPLA